jgi:hypothetical protein
MKLVQSKPAIKARDLLALHEIAAGGNVKDAMIKAGFKPTTANVSGKLKKKKSWVELMDRFLPDSLLSKVHNDGLNATQFIPQGIGKGETELVEVPDHSVRHKYLKTAYDLKGRIKQPDEHMNGGSHNTLIVITAPQPEAIASQPTPIEHETIQ